MARKANLKKKAERRIRQQEAKTVKRKNRNQYAQWSGQRFGSVSYESTDKYAIIKNYWNLFYQLYRGTRYTDDEKETKFLRYVIRRASEENIRIYVDSMTIKHFFQKQRESYLKRT